MNTDQDEIKLAGTTDPLVWTKAFAQAIAKNPAIPTDEGTMLGWFANAISAGYDKAQEQASKDVSWSRT